MYVPDTFTSGSVSKSSNNFGFLPNTNLYRECLAKLGELNVL